jgi:hypothetical protein
MTRSVRLKASVLAEQSARFTALAERRGLSTSRLLATLVDEALAKSGVPEGEGLPAHAARRTSDYVPPTKYTVRLQGLDAAALERRAGERGMPASSYAANVLRAHLRANPPMPFSEFEQLKRVVNELAGVRSLLVRLVESDDPGRLIEAEIANAVRKLLPALKSIRQDVQAVLEASSKSWEVGDA